MSKKRDCGKTLDEQAEGEKGMFPGIPAAAPFFFPGGNVLCNVPENIPPASDKCKRKAADSLFTPLLFAAISQLGPTPERRRRAPSLPRGAPCRRGNGECCSERRDFFPNSRVFVLVGGGHMFHEHPEPFRLLTLLKIVIHHI